MWFVLACLLLLPSTVRASKKATDTLGVRDDLHFPLYSRATNKDGSLPTYKNPDASIEDRVADLLPRMTVEEKVAQLIQGDMNGWMSLNDPLDDTKVFNQSGLEQMMATKAGAIWGGYLVPWDKFVYGVSIGQKYLMENTTLGIPAIFQSEGLHGFTNNGTIWPSPIGLAASFNTDLLEKAAATIADEAEGLGFTQLFAPVLDMSRELRWGRVEENFGEDPFLTGEMGHAYVTGLQSGRRRNVSSTANARMAATCKHFAAFGSPQGGLNIAQVSGGERELRTIYLKPFNRACVESLTIMTAYSSYDGIPAIANSHLLTDILREEWGYQYYVTSDAGSVDLLINLHGTCDTRECAAKTALENGLSGEMGGGTYTYLTLPDQVKAGTVDIKYIDETVKTMLRTKFTLGLFENPYPYDDYLTTLRTPETRELLHQMELESIVLLENKQSVLPLSINVGSVALIGPQVDRVSFGDYVFFNASLNGISPLAGFTEFLSNSSVKINYAEGCKLWSNDHSGFDAAMTSAIQSDVAVVMVGTWSLDQTLLWTPGTNATTGEHVDLSDLGLVGAQLALVQAIKSTGKPTIVVFVSGKPVAEPWIQTNADAVIQQFYPGELGGLALAEIIFGAANPSGKLPVSFPRSVGTTPVFYNYLKGSRPLDPGLITANGSLVFGHQYVLDSPVPLWSFGHGLSYTTFKYSNLLLSSSTIGINDDFNVTVTVHNTGSVDGKEVVQVYLTDVVSSVVTPNQELVGFQKVDISAGASKTVTILVQSLQLAVWTLQSGWVVEPGAFAIKVGTSDQTFLNATLTVQ
ncbi:glycoside hydrolase family 3 protein [Heterobasidion irregulare TC 32-1]|uniref:Glycoside hydrolase family 3 protein n=1 Tax=Heterobasidion irregulare (strain TC 32-1) TaxID=747525 RepID=W4KGC4_HETIT|nr:glycoside hydrolase family 3 protein [Heterobasidion irregulare TC 32-1]ETW84887.1 glycoside hydrolase family 3 protein [Heterobasidion irregulare TC 32-1]